MKQAGVLGSFTIARLLDYRKKSGGAIEMNYSLEGSVMNCNII